MSRRWRCRYCGVVPPTILEHILQEHPDSDGARVFRMQGAAPLTAADKAWAGQDGEK